MADRKIKPVENFTAYVSGVAVNFTKGKEAGPFKSDWIDENKLVEKGLIENQSKKKHQIPDRLD